ncbi:MAG: hypothetical protein K0S65_86 [Labilithrix sp.]|nr:hypothetical protein [Labilithrix sp.]
MSTTTPRPLAKTGGLGFTGWLGAAVAVAIIGGGIYWAVSSAAGGDEMSASELKVLAESACEGAVEQNLKAPSSAEYDSSASGSGPWTVTGSVDAENSFGAMIRSTYTCSVEQADGRMVATLEMLD